MLVISRAMIPHTWTFFLYDARFPHKNGSVSVEYYNNISFNITLKTFL